MQLIHTKNQTNITYQQFLTIFVECVSCLYNLQAIETRDLIIEEKEHIVTDDNMLELLTRPWLGWPPRLPPVTAPAAAPRGASLGRRILGARCGAFPGPPGRPRPSSRPHSQFPACFQPSTDQHRPSLFKSNYALRLDSYREPRSEIIGKFWLVATDRSPWASAFLENDTLYLEESKLNVLTI